MRAESSEKRIPPAVRARLAEWHGLLHSRAVEKVVLTPLVLRDPLEALLVRRSRLFSTWVPRTAAFGVTIHFTYDVRPTTNYPKGRQVTGEFDILALSTSACLITYDLRSEEEARGPGRLARRSYPLATRPFIRSRDLLSELTRLGREQDWTPICVDAMGYDRETQEFRRDMKHQPATDAFREMVEQGRLVHQMKVSFRGENNKELLHATLDRYGRSAVYAGDVVLAADRLVLPAIGQSAERAQNVSVQREPEPQRQKVIRLVFPEGTFATASEAGVLCEAVRKGPGLSVTTVHLNPYLNAQIVDWLTGGSAQLTITDTYSAYLIPRSESPKELLERVIATIFRYFGEADIRVEGVTDSNTETP